MPETMTYEDRYVGGGATDQHEILHNGSRVVSQVCLLSFGGNILRGLQTRVKNVTTSVSARCMPAVWCKDYAAMTPLSRAAFLSLSACLYLLDSRGRERCFLNR